jgi:hypothetical protein
MGAFRIRTLKSTISVSRPYCSNSHSSHMIHTFIALVHTICHVRPNQLAFLCSPCRQPCQARLDRLHLLRCVALGYRLATAGKRATVSLR